MNLYNVVATKYCPLSNKTIMIVPRTRSEINNIINSGMPYSAEYNDGYKVFTGSFVGTKRLGMGRLIYCNTDE